MYFYFDISNQLYKKCEIPNIRGLFTDSYKFNRNHPNSAGNDLNITWSDLPQTIMI